MAEATGEFHRRMVEMSGNATLTIISGMLHEITVRHTAFAIKERRQVSKADYDKLLRSYRRLLTLLRSGDGAGAEAHWRKHLDTARELLSRGWRPSRSATSCGDGAGPRHVHRHGVVPRLPGDHVGDPDEAPLELSGRGVDEPVLLVLLVDGLRVEHQHPHLAGFEVASRLQRRDQLLVVHVAVAEVPADGRRHSRSPSVTM